MNTNNNPGQIQVIQIIHASLMMGVALFLGVIFIILPDGNLSNTENSSSDEMYSLFSFIAMAMCVMGIFTGNILFGQLLKKSKSKDQGSEDQNEISQDSIASFSTAHIIRLALLEAPALFACVTMFLIKSSTGSLDLNQQAVQISLAVIGMFFLMMIYLFPNRDKILSALNKR